MHSALRTAAPFVILKSSSVASLGVVCFRQFMLVSDCMVIAQFSYASKEVLHLRYGNWNVQNVKAI